MRCRIALCTRTAVDGQYCAPCGTLIARDRATMAAQAADTETVDTTYTLDPTARGVWNKIDALTKKERIVRRRENKLAADLAAFETNRARIEQSIEENRNAIAAEANQRQAEADERAQALAAEMQGFKDWAAQQRKALDDDETQLNAVTAVAWSLRCIALVMLAGLVAGGAYAAKGFL